MKATRVAALGLAVTVLGLVLPARAWSEQPPDDPRINPAIDKAKAYLRSQGPSGSWVHHSGMPENNIGLTCLCALALMEADTPKSDPIIVNAAAYVKRNLKTLDKKGNMTYNLALAIIFLDRYGTDRDAGPDGANSYKDSIRSMTVRIAAGQNQKNGAWGYDCPVLNGGESGKWLDFLKNNQDKTVPDIDPDKAPLPPQATDNSNTQFAILALWIGHRHGVPVNYPLQLAAKRFRKTQNPQVGSWSYDLSGMNDKGSSMSMTAAGLLALALGHSAKLEAKMVTVKGGAKFTGTDGAGDPATPAPVENKDNLENDPQVLLAAKYLADLVGINAGQIRNIHYALWSVERVAVMFGWEKAIQGKDWYAWGSNFLVTTQATDGSFPDIEPHTGAIADTAFSILFLRKADLVGDAQKFIRKTTVRAGGLAGAKVKPDEKRTTASKAKDAAEEKTQAQIEVEAKKAKDEAEKVEQTREANGLRDLVVNGIGARQDAALKKLRDTPGAPYTYGLVEALKKLDGGGITEQARNALSERLARQNATSLRNYLVIDEKELRLAAAGACALKPEKSLVPDLIDALADKDQEVSDKALEALKSLTGQGYGKMMDKWKSWWEKQAKTAATK